LSANPRDLGSKSAAETVADSRHRAPLIEPGLLPKNAPLEQPKETLGRFARKSNRR